MELEEGQVKASDWGLTHLRVDDDWPGRMADEVILIGLRLRLV